MRRAALRAASFPAAAVLLAALAALAACGPPTAGRDEPAPRESQARVDTDALFAIGDGLAKDLRATGGPFLPYRVCRIGLERPSGILGAVEIHAIGWDGSERLAFSEAGEAFGESLDAAFYLDEESRGLRVSADGPGGPAVLVLDLAAAERAKGGASDAERARRERMRALAPPVGVSPQRREGPLLLEGNSFEEAARRAAMRFAPESPGTVLAALALFALISAAQAASSLGGRARAALVLAAALAASAAAVLLAPRAAILYSLPFPEPAGWKPETRLLEEKVESAAGYSLIRYGDEGGALRLVGFRTPSGSSLPLDQAVAEGWDCRLTPPPLVVRAGGSLSLRSESLTLGWVRHGSD